VNPTCPTGDDHGRFRRFARLTLSTKGREVVGKADGDTAGAAVQATPPAVSPRDTGLSDIDGFEVSRRLPQTLSAPSLVLTISRNASDDGRLTADSPASGFLPRQEPSGTANSALVIPTAARRLHPG